MFAKKTLTIPCVAFVLLASSCGIQNSSSVSDDASEEKSFAGLEAELKSSGIQVKLGGYAKDNLDTPYARKMIAAFYEKDSAVIKRLINLQNLIHTNGKVIFQDANEKGKQTKIFRTVKVIVDGHESAVAREPSGTYRWLSDDRHVEEFNDDIAITVAVTDLWTKGKNPFDILMRQISLGEVIATMKPSSTTREIVQFFIPKPDMLDSKARKLTFSTEAMLIDRNNFDALLTVLKDTDLRDFFGSFERSITFGFVYLNGIWDREQTSKYTIYRKMGSDAGAAVKKMISENK